LLRELNSIPLQSLWILSPTPTLRALFHSGAQTAELLNQSRHEGNHMEGTGVPAEVAPVAVHDQRLKLPL